MDYLAEYLLKHVDTTFDPMSRTLQLTERNTKQWLLDMMTLFVFEYPTKEEQRRKLNAKVHFIRSQNPKMSAEVIRECLVKHLKI